MLGALLLWGAKNGGRQMSGCNGIAVSKRLGSNSSSLLRAATARCVRYRCRRWVEAPIGEERIQGVAERSINIKKCEISMDQYRLHLPEKCGGDIALAELDADLPSFIKMARNFPKQRSDLRSRGSKTTGTGF